jgi:hypothetical protein
MHTFEAGKRYTVDCGGSSFRKVALAVEEL